MKGTNDTLVGVPGSRVNGLTTEWIAGSAANCSCSFAETHERFYTSNHLRRTRDKHHKSIATKLLLVYLIGNKHIAGGRHESVLSCDDLSTTTPAIARAETRTTPINTRTGCCSTKSPTTRVILLMLDSSSN